MPDLIIHEQLKIKEYDNWDLFLHVQQYPYIGRCYAWAKRDDAQSIIGISPEEVVELFGFVIPEWNHAVSKLFNHDLPNVAFLGNRTPHLHAQLIPRYKSPREFCKINFTDPRPGGNFAPYPKKEIPLEMLLQIKTEIKRAI